MVRQIFREAKDAVKDSFRSGREEVTKTFDNLSNNVRDTYRSVDEFYKNPPHIKLALPSIQVSQNECNTVINVNNNAFITGLNIQYVHRNPYCTPSFKIPEFDPNGYDLCGQVYILLGFGYKLLGFYTEPETSASIPIRIPVGVQDVFKQYQKCYPNTTFETFLGYGDGTGFYYDFIIDDVLIRQESILSVRVNHDCVPLNPPFGYLSLPTFILAQAAFTIYGNKLGIIPELLSRLTTSEYIPEVLRIQSSNKDKGCQYPPPPPEPPPPPLQEDCCRMGCCPNVGQNDQLLRLILKRIGEPKEVTIFDEDLLSTHPVLGGLLSPTQFQNIVGRRFQKTLARMSPNFPFEPQSQESCLGE